jgi:DNA-binding IclR family transcriptional regulator
VAQKSAKPSIQVIERMMQLLDVLSQHATPATLKQLAQATQLHPSTAHRILGVMVDNRLVDRIEPGMYRLGIRLVELGSLVKSRISVRQEALPYMQALHQQLGETVNLSVRRDDEDTPQRVAEYAKRSGLPRYTDHTLTELVKLNRELDEIRGRRYAYDNEEAERGVCCVGAGIFNDEGQLVAGLSVSAPTERFRKNWAEPVRQAAERISRAMGFQPR